jgi:hypothetical protein
MIDSFNRTAIGNGRKALRSWEELCMIFLKIKQNLSSDWGETKQMALLLNKKPGITRLFLK